MKTKLLTIAIAAPLLFSAAAFAAPVTSDFTSSTNVNLAVDDGIATIYGNVDSRIEKTMIESQVKALDGVEDVRNLLFVSE